MVTVEERYEHLEKTIRGYNISADLGQVKAAYLYAREHHGAQMRRDGTPYITHPINVAQIWTASPSSPPCCMTALRIPTAPMRTSPRLSA